MLDLVAQLRALSAQQHDDLSIGDEAADLIEQMTSALEGVVRVADRKTVEFDAARAAIAAAKS